ncbi:hypothetical protein M501DRAFT_1000774 [Patellaria atrata CBS 101060]|uniref:Putative gamma-glutamylcyclotransferase n=1 Tax=Patellaria atrata CBS 101060 TaxID=1346257 RepID=A0A9P4VQ42_9PEZI|nr:hypothetical protein M501DRAFT_1000774 [Patellaria atrata CBS 101060]
MSTIRIDHDFLGAAFFYGTLMSPSILFRVIHGTPNPPTYLTNPYTSTPALLPHHRRHRVRHADYPGVLPSSTPTASVRGTLVRGLTFEDIRRLDIFEGSEYERRRVKVRVLTPTPKATDEKKAGAEGAEGSRVEETEGEEVECETYIWIADAEDLELQEWDFAEFVREKMRFWVGGDEFAGRESFRRVFLILLFALLLWLRFHAGMKADLEF